MGWDNLADDETIKRTKEALMSHGINVEVAQDKNAAIRLLEKIIPEGAEVMTASSTTLSQIGFLDMLKLGAHGWHDKKQLILSEPDPVKRAELRKHASIATYYLGSVHAVTENGELITASASGSQLGAYAFTADNLILVVGTQKIVKDIDEGLKRIKEESLPLEVKRMQSVGYPGSVIGEILIMERIMPGARKVTVIFVKEKLGF